MMKFESMANEDVRRGDFSPAGLPRHFVLRHSDFVILNHVSGDSR